MKILLFILILSLAGCASTGKRRTGRFMKAFGRSMASHESDCKATPGAFGQVHLSCD